MQIKETERNYGAESRIVLSETTPKEEMERVNAMLLRQFFNTNEDNKSILISYLQDVLLSNAKCFQIIPKDPVPASRSASRSASSSSSASAPSQRLIPAASVAPASPTVVSAPGLSFKAITRLQASSKNSLGAQDVTSIEELSRLLNQRKELILGWVTESVEELLPRSIFVLAVIGASDPSASVSLRGENLLKLLLAKYSIDPADRNNNDEDLIQEKKIKGFVDFESSQQLDPLFQLFTGSSSSASSSPSLSSSEVAADASKRLPASANLQSKVLQMLSRSQIALNSPQIITVCPPLLLSLFCFPLSLSLSLFLSLSLLNSLLNSLS